MAFRTINVEFRFHEQSGMLFLWTINPCQEEARFERGIPVSSRSGHGIGVQSICAIVERHGGYQFSVEGGRFILLNGEEYDLQVAYDFSVEGWSIPGAAPGLDESGMAAKELHLLEEGDVITIIWKLAFYSGGRRP